MYSPGPSWQVGVAFQDQPGFSEQLKWWKALGQDKKLVIIGHPLESPTSLLVGWWLPSLDEVEKTVQESPLVKSGVLQARNGPGIPKRC